MSQRLSGSKRLLRRVRDISGKTFDRLHVLYPAGKSKSGKSRWVCRCECGNTELRTVAACDLLNGHSRSCGCLQRETASKGASKRFREHGFCSIRSDGKTRGIDGYNSWLAMCRRCLHPTSVGWKHYGGANPPVKIHPRWLDFKKFIKDLGPKPDGFSLGRLGDTGDYTPGNAFWMSRAEQIANRKPRQKKSDAELPPKMRPASVNTKKRFDDGKVAVAERNFKR